MRKLMRAFEYVEYIEKNFSPWDVLQVEVERDNPIFTQYETSVSCLEENDLVSFLYINFNRGPIRRCGYYLGEGANGNILVYDFSVDGPRLFNPAYIEDLEVLIENSEIPS